MRSAWVVLESSGELSKCRARSPASRYARVSMIANPAARESTGMATTPKLVRPANDTSDPGGLALASYRDEAQVLEGLLPLAEARGEEKRQTEDLARRLVHAARAGRREHGSIDAFLT